MQKIIDEMKKDFILFAKTNPHYLLCSMIYVFVGSVILGGGIFSLFLSLAVFFVCLIVVFSPLGELLLRFLEKVRRLETNKEKEYLIPLFLEVYNKAKEQYADIGDIEICVIDNMKVNAFAIGKHTIAVTKGAMQTFSADELKAVLIHEIAHIKYLDTVAGLYMQIGNGLFAGFVMISRFFMFLIDFIQSLVDKSGFIKFIVIFSRLIFDLFIFLLTFLIQLVASINSRKNEYRADKFAYDLGYGAEMISALYLLEKINLGDNSNIIQRMTASHPRITARIEQLEELTAREYGYS